jgi:hypothetical protein
VGYPTTYLEQKRLDDLTGVAPFSLPGQLWVALTTIVLTRTDTAMPPIPNTSAFWSPAAFASSQWSTHNLVDVVFANATSDWPTLPGWAVLDDPLAGNVIYAGAFTDQVGLVAAGDTPTITAGDLTITGAGL